MSKTGIIIFSCLLLAMAVSLFFGMITFEENHPIRKKISFIIAGALMFVLTACVMQLVWKAGA